MFGFILIWRDERSCQEEIAIRRRMVDPRNDRAASLAAHAQRDLQHEWSLLARARVMATVKYRLVFAGARRQSSGKRHLPNLAQGIFRPPGSLLPQHLIDPAHALRVALACFNESQEGECGVGMRR